MPGYAHRADIVYVDYFIYLFTSAICCPWLDFDLPPGCPQAMWCHWGEIESFTATYWPRMGWQSVKYPLKYSAMAGNWTWATGRTDSEIHLFSHWAIVVWQVDYAHYQYTLGQCEQFCNKTEQVILGGYGHLWTQRDWWTYPVSTLHLHLHGKVVQHRIIKL